MNHILIIKARRYRQRSVYSRIKNESSPQNNFDGRSFGMLSLQAGADPRFSVENTYE